MTSSPSKRMLVIGVGNPYRGDDAVGPLLARDLRSRLESAIEVVEHSGEGASLMERWKGADLVVIIDAVSSGSPPGTIHRLDASRDRIPSDFLHYSSHAFSVAEAIEMARALAQLPARVLVIGIEGKAFEAGASLSNEVAAALEEVKAIIRNEVGRFLESQVDQEH